MALRPGAKTVCSLLTSGATPTHHPTLNRSLGAEAAILLRLTGLSNIEGAFLGAYAVCTRATHTAIAPPIPNISPIPKFQCMCHSASLSVSLRPHPVPAHPPWRDSPTSHMHMQAGTATINCICFVYRPLWSPSLPRFHRKIFLSTSQYVHLFFFFFGWFFGPVDARETCFVLAVLELCAGVRDQPFASYLILHRHCDEANL